MRNSTRARHFAHFTQQLFLKVGICLQVQIQPVTNQETRSHQETSETARRKDRANKNALRSCVEIQDTTTLLKSRKKHC